MVVIDEIGIRELYINYQEIIAGLGNRNVFEIFNNNKELGFKLYQLIQKLEDLKPDFEEIIKIEEDRINR